MKKQSIWAYGLTLTAYALLISTIQPQSMMGASAASPMPVTINTINLTDAELITYYQGIETKSGDDLLASLNQIIQNHNEYDYDSDSHRTIYKIIDRNWDLSPLSEADLANFDYTSDNPYIRKLYADYNDDAATADRFKNDGASRVSFDKEHIWAQSLGGFGRSGGAGSDFHALWPSDVRGNQQAHSNYNFAVPTSSINEVTNDKGSYVGRNGYMTGSSEKVFEPLDEYKGDIARAMFYMPARYYTYEDVLHPKLSLVNGSPAALVASPTQPGLAGDLETLLSWHRLDPVDYYEVHRNNLIYNNYQANRNPFIDYPDLADIAYDPTYTGAGAALTPGTSTAASLPDAPLALSRIGAKLVDEHKIYYFLDSPKKEDFIVTAFYNDDSSQVITNYSLSIVGQEDLTFLSIGDYEIVFSYTDTNITKTVTLLVNATLSTVHIVIVGVALLILLVVIISIPKLRKKAVKSIKKTAKKTVKKSSTKKSTASKKKK